MCAIKDRIQIFVPSRKMWVFCGGLLNKFQKILQGKDLEIVPISKKFMNENCKQTNKESVERFTFSFEKEKNFVTNFFKKFKKIPEENKIRQKSLKNKKRKKIK